MTQIRQRNQRPSLNDELFANGRMVVLILLLVGLRCVPAMSQVKPTPTPTPTPTPVLGRDNRGRHPTPTPTPKPTPTPTPTPPGQCTGSSSAELIRKAWDALHANRNDEALACAQTVIDKWGSQAREQQAMRQQSGRCEVRPTPEEKAEYNHTYWALNDVATGYLIRGRAFTKQGRFNQAKDAYHQVGNYDCAYYWDPKAKKGQGMFVRVINAAQ